MASLRDILFQFFSNFVVTYTSDCNKMRVFLVQFQCCFSFIAGRMHRLEVRLCSLQVS